MSRQRIFMIASENGALPGGKAGGVGDVIRELPRALADAAQAVVVITPAYGKLQHAAAGMQNDAPLTVGFGGRVVTVQTHTMTDTFGVQHVVLDHPLFDPLGDGSIYCDDGAERPFATDAGKFALLSVAAGQYLLQHAGPDDIIHAHDWHAASLLVLRALDPHFRALQQNRTVLTLHNLSLQGIRPLQGDPSSLREWFPSLDIGHPLLIDPRYRDCYNPVAAGIQLADAVNTVSPTNAREILLPNDPGKAFRGGEGLEHLLHAADDEDRLYGILNGCDYVGDYPRSDWQTLRATISASLAEWTRTDSINASVHKLAASRLDGITAAPTQVLTSVGRLTPQKILLLLHRHEGGRSALCDMLEALPQGVLFVLLGSGDRDMETDLVMHMRDHDNFIFLRGFSETLSSALYSSGHWFVMPSSFEPCGISQMMAMRCGQPCLVHGVGGLRDTVKDGATGLVFHGDSLDAQAEAMHETVKRAVTDYAPDTPAWRSMSIEAARQRFLWSDSAHLYQKYLYST